MDYMLDGGAGSAIGGIASGIGSAASSAISGAASAEAQKLANAANLQIFEESKQFNAEQAAANRSYQGYMSSTAHQREVQDLINAGLNPVLSAGGRGASSPSGDSASAPSAPDIKPVNPWSGVGPALASALGTAKDVMQFSKQMESSDADIASKKAAALASVSAANNSQASAQSTRANMPSVEARAKSANAEADAAIARAAADQAKAGYDKKGAGYDFYAKRILQMIQGAASATGMFRGLQGIQHDSDANTRSNETHLRNQGIYGTELP